MGNLNYNLNFEMLCAKYELGHLKNEPEQVTGGLLHRMYRLQTDKALYAVKALNPQIMQRDTAMYNYTLSEKVANMAYQNGINAVPAIVSKDRFMHEVEGQFYLLFPWVEGKALPSGEIDMECCKWIGEILAKIHKIDFSTLLDHHPNENFEPVNASTVRWNEYALQAKEEGLEWSNLLFDNLSKINHWEQLVKSSAEQLSNYRVISHRDLDQKNVLWDVQHVPIIIDWEAAGPIHPTQELIDVALYWSGFESGSISNDAFCTLISSYRDHGGEIYANWSDVLNYGFHGKLEWLAYNIRRSLGQESADDAERELGTLEVISTITALNDYDDFIPMCLLWLSDL
ncbi:aminoglycoside phosphotransferase family protein [Paenibacillus sp. FSL R10-2734]|uniref:aminoglycoside phosphotransferase family protein n=1 Tax=Paenibacillus sp. FSL R10-2734 TaxID=2954691 RepID=UPI0030D8B671